MQTQLHEIWPTRCYCGPAVLAALTGCDAKQDVRAWVNAVRRRRHNAPVMGMHHHEIEGVLASRGYGFRKTADFPRGFTLEQFAAEADPNTFYIVNVTGHYVALLNGTAADNWTRFGKPVSEHHSRRAWVKNVWAVAA